MGGKSSVNANAIAVDRNSPTLVDGMSPDGKRGVPSETSSEPSTRTAGDGLSRVTDPGAG
jgi:hypothetical protein